VQYAVGVPLPGGHVGPLDASANWYGSNSAAAVVAELEMTGGAIDYTPWLDVGTDTVGTSCDGFQGDYSTLHVAAASAQVGATGRIQEGINLLTDGALTGGARLVLPEAGTYQENAIANKALTLSGPNAGTAGSGVRVAEAMIVANGNTSAVVSVTAANVTIDGMSIDGDDTSLVGFPLFSGDDTNASYTVQATVAASPLTVRNNILKRAFIGVRADGPTSGTALTGSRHPAAPPAGPGEDHRAQHRGRAP
jgi:hypothetical protein